MNSEKVTAFIFMFLAFLISFLTVLFLTSCASLRDTIEAQFDKTDAVTLKEKDIKEFKEKIKGNIKIRCVEKEERIYFGGMYSCEDGDVRGFLRKN